LLPRMLPCWSVNPDRGRKMFFKSLISLVSALGLEPRTY
jgi:hypothetical protein